MTRLQGLDDHPDTPRRLPRLTRVATPCNITNLRHAASALSSGSGVDEGPLHQVCLFGGHPDVRFRLSHPSGKGTVRPHKYGVVWSLLFFPFRVFPFLISETRGHRRSPSASRTPGSPCLIVSRDTAYIRRTVGPGVHGTVSLRLVSSISSGGRARLRCLYPYGGLVEETAPWLPNSPLATGASGRSVKIGDPTRVKG